MPYTTLDVIKCSSRDWNGQKSTTRSHQYLPKWRSSIFLRKQVANCQLEKPKTKTTLKFAIRDYTLQNTVSNWGSKQGPILGFTTWNTSILIDGTHDLIQFPHLTMQVKSNHGENGTKPQFVKSAHKWTKSPLTTTTITALIDYPSYWNKTSSLIILVKSTGTAKLLTSHSMSGTIDKKRAVTVNIYRFAFSITKIHRLLILQQHKFNEAIDTAIVCVIPEDHLYLASNLNKTFFNHKPDRWTRCF